MNYDTRIGGIELPSANELSGEILKLTRFSEIAKTRLAKHRADLSGYAVGTQNEVVNQGLDAMGWISKTRSDA